MIAGLSSVLLHLAVLLGLALIVLVAKQPEEELVLTVPPGSASTDIEICNIDIEPEPDASSSAALSFAETQWTKHDVGELASLSLSQGDQGLDLASELAELSKSLKGVDYQFETQIQDALEHGIDIVIVFDSTGSMQNEISAVRQRIDRIGSALLSKLPRARLSLVTYRDRSDEYLVKGIRLTSDLSEVLEFLGNVRANGGGDRAEAITAGMAWAMKSNNFRRQSRKVMLIFGDAEPHDLSGCTKLARRFRRLGKASVSTVVCGNGRRSATAAFYTIARAGRGESHQLRSVARLMEELLVLCFGREHRESVLEFFEL